MKQELTTDAVSAHVAAAPHTVYDLVSDVTRTPELSADVVRCTWLNGATGPVRGARFEAVNTGGRGPDWKNRPVVTVAEPGCTFAFERTERFAGTIEWRFELEPEGEGTRVTESYRVLRPVSPFGWFVIGTLYGSKDRRAHLHASMEHTLNRIVELLGAPARK
jgi:hypothetical protein